MQVVCFGMWPIRGASPEEEWEETRGRQPQRSFYQKDSCHGQLGLGSTGQFMDHVTNTPNHYPDRALELGYLLLSIGHWLRVSMGPQCPSISGLSHEAARESPQEHTAGAGNKMPLDWCAQERWEEGTGAGHPQPMSQVDLGRRACLRVPPSSQG